MARRSNKSIAEILSLSSINLTSLNEDYNGKHIEIDKKIAVVTEGLSSYKFWELIFKDRNRLSKENALTVCDYLIAMKREINPRCQANQKAFGKSACI